MTINQLIFAAIASTILVGCGEKKVTNGYVRMSTLHALEVESVSMIAEEDGNEKMLFRIPCTAWLGVDLDKVEYDDRQSGQLILKLPPIEVKSSMVNEEKVITLDERQSIWASRNTAQWLKEKALQRAQAEVTEIAMSDDTIKLAKDQTRRLIECFYSQCEPNRKIVVEWKND